MNHAELWNRFIDEVYNLFLDDNSKSFSEEQKNAIIAFAYDAEVANGGHIAFFDCFGHVFSINEVANALQKISGEKFVSNFLSASSHIHCTSDFGYMSDEESDSDPAEDFVYYEINPTLPELLETFIYENKTNIFT